MIRLRVVAVSLASILLLSGCALGAPANTDAAPKSTRTSTQSSTPKPAATSTASTTPNPIEARMPTQAPGAAACGGLNNREALFEGVQELRQVSYLSSYTWDTTSADTSGYDPCAALSWITVTIQGGTVSSPCQIMLFNRGQYLGTTTREAYGFWPRVERIDDFSIQVTYTWPRPGESNAAASGRTIATFRWDPNLGHVVMGGDVPPS